MKLLYLMWIDWNWIWQRPQILADHLSADWDVTVAFPHNLISRTKLQKNPYPAKYRRIYVVPFYNRSSVLRAFMSSIIKWSLRDIKKFDAVWVGHPIFAEAIPEDYKGKIIYDCMDNHGALASGEAEKKAADALEKELIARSDLILVSGELLKQKIIGLRGEDQSVVLVRNGYSPGSIHEPGKGELKESYKLGYIGTISEWMDYTVIQDSLEKHADIEYHLLGIVAGNNYRKQERLYYEGVVEHKELYNRIREYDCLVMPFQVNEIVLSVDPVKLYEYISFGKCIISVFYPEIERFGDFVYFYRTAEEYSALLEELTRSGFPPKYSAGQQKEFLSENTWDSRYLTVRQCIEDME